MSIRNLKLYNTRGRVKEDFKTLTPGIVKMYSCGVTVYDLSHVGHARMLIVFDVISRYLRFAGYRVTFVRNFTDIEDKIIRRAQQDGVPASEVSERYIAAFREDVAALGVMPPEIEPKATEHVPEMIAVIERLVARDFAYVVEGDVYFEIRRFPRYGQLSGKNLDELLVGARVDVDERKRDPRDFALWKSAKPGEPAWPSPWGPGRPGWHIECSAMAMRYLGETFDIHGGGEDLIFPHHECEIAQSEAATDQPFAKYWLHNGMVNMGREKMSKSLGNTLTIRELVKRHEPDALRLWLLGTHYRHPIDYSEERLGEAGRALSRLRGLRVEAQEMSSPGIGGWDPPAVEVDATDAWLAAIGEASLIRQLHPLVERFKGSMDDDFNTPGALAALFDMSRELYRYRDGLAAESQKVAFANGVRVLVRLGGVLGLFHQSLGANETPSAAAAIVAPLVEAREAARKQRDWKRADELREAIAKLGWSVEDTATGPRLAPRR